MRNGERRPDEVLTEFTPTPYRPLRPESTGLLSEQTHFSGRQTDRRTDRSSVPLAQQREMFR